MADGLGHRQVNAAVKAKDGFLWFATANGLSRFDGYAFRNYNTSNAGIPFENVEYFGEDGMGVMWLLAASGVNNICLFNPRSGRASRLPGYFDCHLNYLYALNDGRILFGSRPLNRWYLYTQGRGIQSIHFQLPPNCYFRFVTSSDKIWFSHNHDFYEADVNGHILAHWETSPEVPETNAVAVPNSKAIFLINGNENRLFRLNENKSAERLDYVPPAKFNTVDNVVNTTMDGIIWRQGRLYHPVLGKIKDFPAEGWDDLESGMHLCMIPSPGELWIGGYFGLYKVTIKRSRFHRYFYSPVSKQDHRNAFRGLLATSHTLFAVSENNGLMKQTLNSQAAPTLAKAEVPENARWFGAIMKRTDGSLFISTYSSLLLSDSAGNHLAPYAPGAASPIWCLYEWSNDSLLTGTSEGLFWLDSRTRKMIGFKGEDYLSSSLQESTINSIHCYDSKELCICSNNGFYVLDKQSYRLSRYSTSDSGNHLLPASCFYECLRDTGGLYWLSTGSGLLRWDRTRNKYRLFSTLDGLSNNVIYAAYPDGAGRLWLSSDYGLMSFNRQNGKVGVYLQDDGITANEFNRISHCRDSNGNIYFGGLNGVTAFNPDDFNETNNSKPEASRVVITSFRQFDADSNRLVDRTEQLLKSHRILLRPADRFFTIDLALLNYTDPEHTSYLWRLDNGAWNVQTDRTLRLSSPPFGHYHLQIKAKESNGTESSNEWNIALDVPAPFYRTAWFIVLCAVFFMSLVILVYYRRRRRIVRENKRLEETVLHRTKVLQTTVVQKEMLLKEIHHRVKNNLQMITSLQQMESRRSTEPHIKAALEESQNRVLSIAFIHQNLYMHEDLTGVKVSEFVRELTNHLLAVNASDTVKVTVEDSIDPVTLDIDTAVPLGLILNELITNSFKYAFQGRNSGTIGIFLRDEGRGHFCFTYTDDGPGLQSETDLATSKTLGLKLIRSLSEQIGGTMIYSRDDLSRFSLHFTNLETKNSEE